MLNIENNIRPPPPNQPNLVSASLPPPPPIAAGVGFLFGSPPPPPGAPMAMMNYSPSMGMPYSSISTFGTTATTATGFYNPPPPSNLFSSVSRSIPQDPFSNFSFDSFSPYSVTQKQQAMSFG